ncbi:hypothetical protein GCM10010918_53540 [Paenibacillus radicis (ex Gao et al. 2016)]|uniref:Uncharacterized protein n=1 Tax=Paenibacillus radicis (ex Gao et al. 2016) TaxID=1737354 RepID=A0A917HST3_9BACL|nr:hypothetical protein GCM10010918_53540 [Paenibacillus radicis (ex Gao et al. 2016)]
MPINKSDKKENQRNQSSFKEEAISTKQNKMANRPPSLNGINKQLP